MQLAFTPLVSNPTEKSRVKESNAIIDKTGQFAEGGIFSDIIFGGMPSTGVDYSCDCGEIEGRYYEGTVCAECNTPVVSRETLLTKKGWIDLGLSVNISPLFYIYFEKIIGVTLLSKILKLEKTMDINGKFLELDEFSPTNITKVNVLNIGYLKFKTHWREICTFFLQKKPEAKPYYDLLDQYEHLVFIDKMIVFSKILRPALLIDKQFVFNEINNSFNFIISTSNNLKLLTNSERTPILVNSMVDTIQRYINQIGEYVLTIIGGKKKFLRTHLLGVRINFSGRNVIAPLPVEEPIDHIWLPYISGLELFKLQIINYMVTNLEVSYNTALLRWTKAQSVFDLYIHQIMTAMINKHSGIKAIINRAPTISYGSILKVKIAKIKIDMNDFTIGISNGILSLIAGDYDGDAILTFPLLDQSLIDAFEIYDPISMYISRENGGLNPFMQFSKDYALGISKLTEV